MKYIFTILLQTFSVFVSSQTININSISTSRQSSGDNGYTLDGIRMTAGSRPKLLNTSNFGSSGTYPKSIFIYDGYFSSGSLVGINTLPINSIFFFGSFNKLDASTQQFTAAEIDSVYNWSLRGGKLIIASGGTYSTFFDAQILNNKWGYTYQAYVPCSINPNSNGNATDIFNGPFGNVIAANEGAAAQGYFSSLTTNSKVLATDVNGKTTLFMDCNTLDLIIADVDGYTNLGGISSGAAINNAQDRFWANTIVFMDKLQPTPVISNISNMLSLNSDYNSYQWYLNNSSIKGATEPTYSPCENGNYFVEVTLNGGCKIQSDIISLDSLVCPDTLAMPNVFTPNNDGFNDNFYPIIARGFIINQVSIYNRWGMLVHKENSPEILWDGKINDEVASSGVYYWILEFNNSSGKENVMRGYVQLIR